MDLKDFIKATIVGISQAIVELNSESSRFCNYCSFPACGGSGRSSAGHLGVGHLPSTKYLKK
jgi:hypothetical protein